MVTLNSAIPSDLYSRSAYEQQLHELHIFISSSAALKCQRTWLWDRATWDATGNAETRELFHNTMLKHTILKKGILTIFSFDFFSMSEPVPSKRPWAGDSSHRCFSDNWGKSGWLENTRWWHIHVSLLLYIFLAITLITLHVTSCPKFELWLTVREPWQTNPPSYACYCILLVVYTPCHSSSRVVL